MAWSLNRNVGGCSSDESPRVSGRGLLPPPPPPPPPPPRSSEDERLLPALIPRLRLLLLSCDDCSEAACIARIASEVG